MGESCAMLITDCNISSNTGSNGAAMYCHECPDSSVHGCSIEKNEAFGVIVWYEYFLPDPCNPSEPNDPEDPLEDPNVNDPNLIRIRQESKTAEALGVSPRTVDGEWRFAKAWLHRELRSQETTDNG